MTRVVFAIPGDIETRTGGYAYDRALLAGLRAQGVDVAHLPLGASFPEPTADDLSAAIAELSDLPADTIALVDALAYAVLPPEALSMIAAPLVALVHHPLADETGLSAKQRRAFEASEIAALAHASAVVTTSQTTADILTRRFAVPAEAITVALPGLDPAAFQQNRPVAPPSIVSVGTLIPRKGYDVLLGALSTLGDLMWTAHIVGSDARHPMLPAILRETAAEPPLAGRVHFHGELGVDAIRALFADATVFALASRNEGFGMVFAEAMAAGIPVVGCAAGAVPEVVPPEAGILVPIDDRNALARALRLMITDRPTRDRYAHAARKRAEALPSWPDSARTVATRLNSLAESL